MRKKGDLRDFERGMVVGLSIMGFSPTTISRVSREWSEEEKISSVDVRGQRRMGRLVGDDRKATGSQRSSGSNQGLQNIISEHTTRPILKQMGYSSRRPHRVLAV